MKVFIATGFDEVNYQRARCVAEILKTMGNEILMGEKFDGRSISEGVKERITSSDCLIALLTRRKRIEKGG